MDKEEISKFKRTHYELEKRIGKIGKKQCASVARLSEELRDILENIESTIERDKSLWNPDINTKIKLAKRGAKLSKKLKYFEEEVVKEFYAGSISQDMGKKFIEVIRFMQNNKRADANRKFEHLLRVMELNRDYEMSKDEMEKKDGILRKKKQKIIALMEELSQVEGQTVDPDRVMRYEEFSKALQQLEETRGEYLSSLSSEPVAKLLDDSDSMRDYFAGMPGRKEMAEMKKFFSEYPELGSQRADHICDMLNFNEKKLSHVCQETTRFRKLIRENRNWFEKLSDLRQTKFLEVDDENDKVLDFYSKKGAGKIVDRIRSLRKDKISCRSEYEKKLELNRKKKKLSAYSKDSLEAELRETDSLIEFLHSPPEDEGLISRVASFFKGDA